MKFRVSSAECVLKCTRWNDMAGISVDPKCKTTFGIGYEKRESLVHRTATTSYPCYGQVLGEFGGSWSCTTFPTANIVIFYFSAKITVNYSDFIVKNTQ